MFAIEVITEFCASHQLRVPDGTLEPLHGHNWCVTVTIESPQLDAIDTVMDFHELQNIVTQVIAPWNNQHLNDVAPFADAINPSAERVAETLAKTIGAALPSPATIVSVWVSEAPGCRAGWRA
jgi:6-pyruvoyltetrahydropterin/6-carboxytetrahydropterin synthase